MAFLLHSLQQLGIVVLVMACSLFGTMGIIKLIKGVFHVGDIGLPNSRKQSEDGQDSNE